MKLLRILALVSVSFCAMQIQAMEKATSQFKSIEEGTYLKQLPSELKKELSQYLIDTPAPQVHDGLISNLSGIYNGHLSRWTEGGKAPFTYKALEVKDGTLDLSPDGTFTLRINPGKQRAMFRFSVQDAHGRTSRPAMINFSRQIVYI